MVRELIARKTDEKRLSMAEVSRRMKRNVAYMADFMNKQIPEELPEQSRLALAEILDVPEEALRGPKTRALLPVAAKTALAPVALHGGDCFQLAPKDARDGARYEAERLERAEIWRVTSDVVDGTGIMPGDCVVVDLNRDPRVNDVVLAAHRDGGQKTLLRLYQPPFLVSYRHAGAPERPVLVDHQATVIRGVIVYRCWAVD